ncbi:DUF402 domain-containing protein [Williamsia deligens]|uniref:DUF402 domain-containing protein n=1 Tax=Williamsia deligens TaxID=321325 RepID=A0ABW3GDW3_9NOCA|nr:DUF402 domain-containing protein [Williamsia deligens]MCP2195970.1 hypothetical protein [Williamsia deligens]
MERPHPPKREVFDVPAGTNTDNKGFVRPVAVFRETAYGLYMSRAADHARFHHLESWLLPPLGLRVSIFHFRPAHDTGQRLYLDVGHFRGPDESGRWHSVDWYLDLVDHPGRPVELLDVDELVDAHRADLISREDTVAAVEIATTTMAGIAAAGHDVEAWLAAQGCPVRWRDG